MGTAQGKDVKVTFGIPDSLRGLFGDEHSEIDEIHLRFFNEDYASLEATRHLRAGDLPPGRSWPVLRIKGKNGNNSEKENGVNLWRGIAEDFLAEVAQCESKLVQEAVIIFATKEFVRVRMDLIAGIDADPLSDALAKHFDFFDPERADDRPKASPVE